MSPETLADTARIVAPLLNRPRWLPHPSLLQQCQHHFCALQVLQVLEAVCDQGTLADAAQLVGPFLSALCAAAGDAKSREGAWRGPLPATRAPLNISLTRRVLAQAMCAAAAHPSPPAGPDRTAVRGCMMSACLPGGQWMRGADL